MISIALVDDHQLIRDGLRRAVESAEDLEMVAEAASLAEARAVVHAPYPDVVILDVRLPDGTGLEFSAELRAAQSDLGIVVLTADIGEETCLAALKAGASALVGKDVPATDVLDAVRRAHRNPRTFTARDLGNVLRCHAQVATAAGVPDLSPREREIMALASEGLAASAIGRQLCVAESTVKTHLSRIYTKLGATNRAQAVMMALRWGLLPSQHVDTRRSA